MGRSSLSVIIPSFKDPNLNKTIESLLTQSRGEIEVLPVLDGYFQPVLEDERVHPIFLNENRGMKNAINTGMRMARGEYVMRLDEHCTFGESFDTILTSQTEYGWMVTPRRYFLDPIQWKVMDIPPVDYEKLVIDKDHGKFAGVRWTSRAEARKDIPIDETMMLQGSCVFMHKKWWDEVIGELSMRYGDHYGDQAEMLFKTWKAGGKLMVNKNTWFAHKHREFKRTHNYTRERAIPGWTAMLEDYGDYYRNEIAPKWGL